MSSQLLYELRELIHRHASRGHNAGEVIDQINDLLHDLQQQEQQTNGRAAKLDLRIKRLPDPPRQDEMISPPCDLPRLGPAFDSKVNWGAKRLPDPLPD